MSGSDQAEVFDSLRTGDHDALGAMPWHRALVGLIVLHLAGVVNSVLRVPRRRRPPGPTDVVFVVANPVAHGATLAQSVVNAVAASGLRLSVLADRRLAVESVPVDRDFPDLGVRSVRRVASISRLARAWRLGGGAAGWPPPLDRWRRLARRYLVLAQCLRYAAAAADVGAAEARLLLCDFDRHSYARPIVSAARRAGIRTATLVHGTPTDTYLPVLSDDILVWGSAQEAFFREHAGDVSVHVVGRPEIERQVQPAERVRRVLVCHSMEDLSPDERSRLGAALGQAGRLGVTRELRPHPRDPDVSRGAGWRALLGEVDLVRAPQEPLAEYVRADDLVLAITSTGAVDALCVGARAATLADPGRTVSCDLDPLRAAAPDFAAAGSAHDVRTRRLVVAAVGPTSTARLVTALRDLCKAAA